jgi:hypothetical protein
MPRELRPKLACTPSVTLPEASPEEGREEDRPAGELPRALTAERARDEVLASRRS